MSKNTEKEATILEVENVDTTGVKEEVKSDEVANEELKTEEAKTPEISEAPVLKAATPAAPNNMIQKHVDNFLAKIAGETPVDDQPRDSTEYWLNKIADRIDDMPAQKELWWHGCELYITPTLSLQFHILNNSGTAFDKSTFTEWLNGFTNIDIAVNGSGIIGSTTLANIFLLRKTRNSLNMYYYTAGGSSYTPYTINDELYNELTFNDRPYRVL